MQKPSDYNSFCQYIRILSAQKDPFYKDLTLNTKKDTLAYQNGAILLSYPDGDFASISLISTKDKKKRYRYIFSSDDQKPLHGIIPLLSLDDLYEKITAIITGSDFNTDIIVPITLSEESLSYLNTIASQLNMSQESLLTIMLCQPVKDEQGYAPPKDAPMKDLKHHAEKILKYYRTH